MLITLVLVSVVAVAAIVWFWMAFPVIHVRYRLTVEVQDVDQLKSGSGVIEVSYAIQPDALAQAGSFNSSPDVKGNAIAVDLGDRGLLFLTFFSAKRTGEQWAEVGKKVPCPFDDVGCLVFAAYDPGQTVGPAYSQVKAALDSIVRRSGPREVPFIALPKLVRFVDINKPGTEVPVMPSDVAASFGPGVELKRVVLELTNEPITPPPDSWPQWLKEKGSRNLGMPREISRG